MFGDDCDNKEDNARECPAAAVAVVDVLFAVILVQALPTTS
jgi:hypothetical protein